MASEKVSYEMNIDALVTGESIAQVSSQTLRNLAIIDRATDKLVLRPLATMSKPEIIKISDEIGTRHFAENMFEYCGIISKNPITHGSFKRIEREAKRFNYSILDRAIENRKEIFIDEAVDSIVKAESVESVCKLNEKDTIIDIRGREETVDVPCEVLNIPFYKLKTEFKKFQKIKDISYTAIKG